MTSIAAIQSIYARDGYVVIPDLIDPQTLAEISRRIDASVQGKGAPPVSADHSFEDGGDRKVVRKLVDLAASDPFFAGVARRPSILEVVAALTGARGVLLYSDQAFLKPALHGSEKPLHQDNAYFTVAPMDAGVTCWLAVDEATVSNGCMNYLPGSHRLGLVEHACIAGTPHLVPTTRSPVAEVPCPIPAGSAIFHHLLVLHGSKANRSPLPRRAWAMHFVADHASCPARPAAAMLRVR